MPLSFRFGTKLLEQTLIVTQTQPCNLIVQHFLHIDLTLASFQKKLTVAKIYLAIYSTIL